MGHSIASVHTDMHASWHARKGAGGQGTHPLLAGLPDVQGLQALLGDEGGHPVVSFGFSLASLLNEIY